MGSNTAEHRAPTLGSIQIVHIGGKRQGEINHFLPGTLNFGRHPNCDVVFSRDALSVSRIHARLECDAMHCRLIGLGSNGTYVNGKLIENVVLQSGDVVTFSETGPKLSFIFQAGQSTNNDSPDKTQRIDLFDQDHTDLIQQIRDVTPLPGKPAQINADYPYDLFNPGSAVSAEPENRSFILHFANKLRSIDKTRVTIGRGKESDLIIDHPRLLDTHALLYYSGSNCFVANSSALRLIWLNGNLLSGDTRLRVNDVLMLNYAGPSLIYRGNGKFQEFRPSLSPDISAVDIDEQQIQQPSIALWLRNVLGAIKRLFNARQE